MTAEERGIYAASSADLRNNDVHRLRGPTMLE
jgi:hypothetical protein